MCIGKIELIAKIFTIQIKQGQKRSDRCLGAPRDFGQQVNMQLRHEVTIEHVPYAAVFATSLAQPPENKIVRTIVALNVVRELKIGPGAQPDADQSLGQAI